MKKRECIIAVNMILMSVLFFSCIKEGMGEYAENTDEIKIVGSKGDNISRNIPPNKYFDEDICYRLWAYDNNTDGYIFNNISSENGIVAKESYGHYIQIDDVNRSRLVDDFKIYGFTDNITKVPESGSIPDVFLPLDGNTTKYNIKVKENESEVPSTLNSVNTQLVDYYRGEFEYIRNEMPVDNKGLIVMNFKHIMSQIKISILHQPDEISGEIYDDLHVTKIELQGDYNSMDYDVKTNTFSNPDVSGLEMRTLWKGDTENDVTTDVKFFVTSTIFPTLNSDREYYLYLTLSGVDAENFKRDDHGRVKVKLTESGLGVTNLNFKQNYSYHIQVFFMSGNVHVIAIRPEVYPWLDGETDNGEQGDMYEDVSLGNTLLFDNLLWADRNMGATEFNPIVSFENCTGFYYQFQRNIPYFPNTLAEGQLVYSVTSNATANAKDPTNLNSNLAQSVNEINEKNAGFYTGTSIIGTKMWTNGISEQPVPPGWRIPSADEFLSIMPSCPAAGNITFLSNINGNGSDKPNTLSVNVVSLKVPKDAGYDYEPDNYNNVNGVTGDPSNGYSSVYIISKSDNLLDNVSKPIKRITKQRYDNTNIFYDDPQWGTIYAIKKIGTDEAYRIRWHIVRPIEGVDNYVLVISKYTASKDDKLLFKESDKNNKYHYRNYDWDYPSAIMYIPIVGMVGAGTWQPGKIGNFGTETILLTTDRIGETQNFKTLRIKIAGDNATNQYIFSSKDYGGNGGQLRLVRDITN